ncbi:MAG: amino acid adenylation domain-containing protein, partial [Cyanobacteria bacterium P01_H01_bin.58]
MTDSRLTTDVLRQRIAALSPERRALFEQQLKARGLSLEAEAPASDSSGLVPPQVRPPVLPLSLAQRNLWVLHQLDPDDSAYHIAMSWRMTGALDVVALKRSLHAIAQRHESLRTVFVEQDSQPCQRILPEIPSSFWASVDLRMLPDAAMQAEIRRFTEQAVRQPFDLSQGPLFRSQLLRLDESTSILLITLHHIVADGWSRGVLMQELATLYRHFRGDESEGESVSLPPLTLQYADYALWQHQWLQSDNCQIQLAYWRKQLASLPALELPCDYTRPRVASFASRTCTHTLSPERVKALKTLSRQQGTTLFTLLLSAFKVLLHHYSAQADIGVGVPVANRHHSKVEPLIGFFVNTLVLRSHLAGTMTFRDLIQQVKQTAADAFQHQAVPFAKVVEALQPERNLSQNPLFQVMFQLQSGYQLQNAATPELDLPGLTLEQTWVEPGHTKFDMTWHGIERDEELLLAVEYRVDLFEASRIQQMLRHFQTLLEGILVNPDRPLAELSFLSLAERHQLLVEWNQTEAPLPAHCFHQCFEAQVEKTPDAIAVIDASQKLTYRQLDQRANQLAHVLRAQGVEPETLVGVCLPRSAELMIALLGVLKAGGAYVPFDAQLPEERLRFILDDAKVSLLLTVNAAALGIHEVLGIAAPGGVADNVRPMVLDLEGDRDQIDIQPIHPPAPLPLYSENLAYVIYTSGSTGMPKGTLLTHRGLINYLHWCTQAYDVAAGNGAPVQSSIGFDATITSLFAPLLAGCPVTLLSETDDIEALSEALQKGDRFSLIKLTPSHLKALAPLISQPGHDKSVSLSADTLSPPIHPSAPNAFIVGGEALQSHDLAFWQQRFPKSRFVNEYGPTEAVVGCCVYDIPLDFDGDAVPIGRPIDNVQLYVLDAYLNPVPVGVDGELYIGGAGVARGYLNRPDLTAERFVPNPFVEGRGRESGVSSQELGVSKAGNEQRTTNNQQHILYKTGDRARYRPDGTLEYLGRIDDQIKLRGYRIEPGEIEAVLCQYPN